MNPRLKSSKKWTAFPKEYSEQIQTVFTENFAEHLKNASLLIEGRIYPDEIVLRVGYLQEGRLTQANFEVSVNYSQEKKDAIENIHLCVDAAASMLMEYLEKTAAEEEVEFPYTWKEIAFQKKKVFVQYNTENTSLEREANRLLGISEGTLLLDDEEEQSEDALNKAVETIEDSSEEIEGPKMFGGKGAPKKKKDSLH